MLGHIIVTAVNAVFPIVGLILLGYILKRVGFLSQVFIKNGSKLVRPMVAFVLILLTLKVGSEIFFPQLWS